jgi:prepilin-type N-terminal cleavage/methylation domain-containing protein
MRCSRGEAGFTLIEVTVGSAIIALAACALAAASLDAVRAEREAETIDRLAGRAQDTVVDLRAIAGYDPSVLAPLAAGGPKTVDGVTLSATPSGSGGFDVVVIAASAGRQAVIKTRLVQEAPPPGAQIAPQAPIAVWSPPALRK